MLNGLVYGDINFLLLLPLVCSTHVLVTMTNGIRAVRF